MQIYLYSLRLIEILYYLCAKFLKIVGFMGNIEIIKGVFDSSLELVHAEVAAGFPDISVDYAHETLDFNRDYIKHPEASFYGDVHGDFQLNSNAKKKE